MIVTEITSHSLKSEVEHVSTLCKACVSIYGRIVLIRLILVLFLLLQLFSEFRLLGEAFVLTLVVARSQTGNRI